MDGNVPAPAPEPQPQPQPQPDPNAAMQAVVGAAANAAANVAAQVGQQVAAGVAAQVAQQAQQAVAGQAAHAAFHAVANANLQREIAKNFKPDKLSLRYKDTQTVETFLYRMLKYFRLMGVHDDATRVELASYQFTGDVMTWWRARYEGQAMTWDQFKDRLRERWADENDVMLARQELRTLKQHKSAIAATSIFDALCLRIPNITDDEKRDKYLAMLKPHLIKELMLMDGLDTYEKLAQKAILLDETMYRLNRRGGGGGSSAMELGNLQESDSESSDDERVAAMGQKPGGQSKGADSVKCWQCGQKGHYAKDCPKPKKNKGKLKGKDNPNGRAQSRPKRG